MHVPHLFKSARRGRVVCVGDRQRQAGERDGGGSWIELRMPARGGGNVRRHSTRRHVLRAQHPRRTRELRIQFLLATIQEDRSHLLVQWPCRDN